MLWMAKPGKFAPLAVMPLLGIMFLAGCAANDFFRPDQEVFETAMANSVSLPSPPDIADSAGTDDDAPSDQAKKPNEGSANSKGSGPGPRTFPEALRRYLHCLRTGCQNGPESQEKSEKENGKNAD